MSFDAQVTSTDAPQESLKNCKDPRKALLLVLP